jgi:hypothetical protein
MALAKDRKRLNVRGGGALYVRELDPTPSNTYLLLGYLSKTDFNDEHQMVGDVDEAGVLPDSKSGSQVFKLATELKQTSIDEIQLLNTAAGKYFEGIYVVTLANGRVQELSIPLIRLNPTLKMAFAAATERRIPLEIIGLAPKAAYTRGVVAFNVVLNQPYVLVEGSSATFNMSNTEASALATAIL